MAVLPSRAASAVQAAVHDLKLARLMGAGHQRPLSRVAAYPSAAMLPTRTASPFHAAAYAMKVARLGRAYAKREIAAEQLRAARTFQPVQPLFSARLPVAEQGVAANVVTRPVPVQPS